MSKTKTKEENATPTVKIYIMGSMHEVPASLTIMKAMEYAGFKFKRGAGCRAGFCGACATLYRKAGDYRIYAALACQTQVEDGMVLTQLPFVPAPKGIYDVDSLQPTASSILKFYPEVARCLSCNACSKVCPQEIQVMDYVQYCLQGQIDKAAELSFDCVQCGLCAIRCPAEIPQYHVGMLARRLHGKYNMSTPETLIERVEEIENGVFEEGFKELKSLSKDDLKKRYIERDFVDQKKA
ncbi:MAG: 4Fe-4S ferredoxin [Candidatus Heimdallarchaeota archaeon]|nr:4Fe-4S ferredoxin [Candidatus Heimdallarchaeota archaeon]MCG3257091.1 4Fe-4S ferredoxin [Candidatus Heimdallarchaeota archaeon]MCK4612151.1 4Fe-4S ferredoxin [Candidatus Heimdallarchaeota archaeon]